MHDTAATQTTGATDAHPDTSRAQLRADLDEAASIAGIDAGVLDALRAKLAGRVFNLVVAGEFKRGKSSIVNALLGAEVLPTGVVPLTSVVTVLRHSDESSAIVALEDGGHIRISLDALADYVTESRNPKNEKHVKEVEVTWPAPWLGRGIRLIDTPGIGSAYQHNTNVTRDYLPQADAVIFVASVDQPVSQQELRFLADIRGYAGRIFCLLNKIDHLSNRELAESVAFSESALREALDADVPVFPVSARVAIESQWDGMTDAFIRSGFASFDTTLQTFLHGDSEMVLTASVHRHLAQLLSNCRLAAELELQALAVPLAKLEENLSAFTAKKTEILQQRTDLDALLNADARKLVKQRIEPDIGRFKQGLTQRLLPSVPDWVRDAIRQQDASPQMALEQRTVGEIRSAYDTFRAQEGAAATAEFEQICARFRQRIQQAVDDLMRYSAELFAIPFEAVRAEPLPEEHSRFYYKFWQDPDSMALLAQTLTGLLPHALQAPLLMRRTRRRVTQLVEMQSGRVRHDFETRIAHATQTERSRVLARIDATIQAIEVAIIRGRAQKAGDQEAIAARRQELAIVLTKIDKLETHAASTG